MRGAATFCKGRADGTVLLEPEVAGKLLDTACNRASGTFGFGGSGDPGAVGEELVLFGMVGDFGLVFLVIGNDCAVGFVAVEVEV
jgi:hypothetical protein